jgi:predicted transcriptional regulator YdeE
MQQYKKAIRLILYQQHYILMNMEVLITMNVSSITELTGFEFIGKVADTKNDDEMKGEGIIPKIWEDFYNHQLLEKIPQKKNSAMIAIYTNYESDETGKYTYGLGAEVINNARAPEGMEKFTIPELKYVIFTTRKGPVQDVLFEAWRSIWEWSKTNKRAFLFDFELYDERALNPNDSQVDIYISIK